MCLCVVGFCLAINERNSYSSNGFSLFVSMLYVVPTPIGNADDITLRALKLLTHTSVIIAERIASIRTLYAIHDLSTAGKTFVSYTGADDDKKFVSFLEQARTQDVVVVSEAGTPGLSDPGKSLIALCHRLSIPFSVLPGATALIPAVVAAPFPTHQFIFLGFLPHKKGRETFLQALMNYDLPVFFYESVHRMGKLFEQGKKIGLTGNVWIAREISKQFESYRYGSFAEAALAWESHQIVPKGEFVIGWNNNPI
ncbi:MAG: 16S rRNA (cytidine(1402)-2'-O)-methyltransferase [Candidatus Absconditabacterales bacterium]|nr:16S rRNA (cytidine(1402)-2'-O)-methyltransferase [Candidatus Absconditabacterales bacterium]